ncbi:MAG: SLC13 family permease [Pseudomonadota bacterium]
MTAIQIMVCLVFFATIAALIFTDKRPSGIFAGSALALVLLQVISLDDILANATNTGLVTLVLLLLVSHSLDKTTTLKRIGRGLLNRSYNNSFWRLFGVAFFSSSILNNTAVVASLISVVKQSTLQVPSKLLIPLSYAAILGGTVTLIGTSTNLIVDSFLIEHGHPGFAFFDFTIFGLTAGLICGFFMWLLRGLLPSLEDESVQYNSYLIEADVEPDSELVGKTIEQNHLRNLPELFLLEIIRNNQLISPVSPDMLIEANDKLIFTGNVKKIESFQHVDGLTMFAETDGLLKDNLTEVIVSNRSTILGKTLKQVGFRALFDAAVVAIRRDGENLSGKIGDLKIQSGDFLLLATGNDFHRRHNIGKNFFIISEQKVQSKLTGWQELFTWMGFIGVIILAATSVVPLATALLFLTAALIITKVSTFNDVKRNLPVNLIMVIVGALSLAHGLEASGVIAVITSTLEPYLIASDPLIALIIVYVLTVLLTEFVTNNAAAALMFPFAYGIVTLLNLPIMPFALAVAFAASASFISPYGYQTNLLVFSASNYKFKHFSKIGMPISIAYACVIITMLNMFYLQT